MEQKVELQRIVFGIGSNVGNREFFLNEAARKLELELDLSNSRRSKIFPNPALLLPDSPPEWNCEFFNIAFSADVDLTKFLPLRILEIVKKIEQNLGRQNRGKWAPREIDIDILMIGNLEFRFDQILIVPHQQLQQRDFFVKTIAEIEPEMLQNLIDRNT